MSENKRTRPTQPRNSRPTIGLFMSNNSQPWELPQWLGVVDAAWELDANLLCFLGRELRTPIKPDAQANVLYELADPDRMDGLIVWAGGFDLFVSPAEMAEFCARYHPLPIVSVENAIAGVPSVLMDNYQAMRQALVHLIEVHGYRRIAYLPSYRLRGQEVHYGMQERYRAYCETMAEYGLSDTNLVYSGEGGIEVLTAWLRERADIEAIAGGSDGIVLFAQRALQSLGMQVPGEVALVGFNDDAEGRVATPPLTTVRPPFYEMGRKAVTTLLALLKGEEIPQQVVLPSELVVRRSCGCELPVVVEAAARPQPAAGAAKRPSKTFKEAFAAQRVQALFDMIQAAGARSVGVVPEWAERLLDRFADEMEGGTTGLFLSALEEVLRQTAAVGGDVAAWQGTLSALRQHVLPYLGDGEMVTSAENLWQQARVLIGETARRMQAHQALQVGQQAGVLREIGQALITTHDMEALADVLAEGLARLDIPTGYLSLYEDAQSPAEWARLVLACDENGHRGLEVGGLRFPSRWLVPEGMWPQERRFSYVVEALYSGERQIGFALLEVGPRDGQTYDALRGELSSALQGVLLMQQVERRALQLQAATEVSQAVSGTLQPDELIQQVVTLARERFDLYYAGLFLVDQTGEWTGEPNRWAVLRAGSGEAGRRMLDEGHKLEIGGASMIGWCVANNQARIALDVGAEATRFANPHLPETRSEMALPLISRGKAIGALTIQSQRQGAFSQEDITALQTMASQVANAIENVRLFEQSRIALTEMEATQRRYIERAWAEYRRTLATSGYRQTGAERTPLGKEVLPETHQAMLEQRPLVSHGDGDADSLVIPVMLRGQPIGAIGFRSAGEKRDWSTEEIALVETVSEQLALAAENLRLIDETQRRAARERLIGEITDKMRRATNVEQIVQTAVDELFKTLRTTRTFVRLGTTPSGRDDGNAGT